MSDRRTIRDRRSWSRERRRKGEQRMFVIELSSSDLGIVELHKSGVAGQADEVSATACCWRRNAAALNTPEGLVELSAALRDVARQHQLHGAEIRVVLSGEFCVMRTFRGPVETVRAEIQQLENRSRLYLSLGPGEKVLVSNVQALDARHAQALAAVCNRATLETIQSAAEAAGIEIAAIEPSLSSLNRAVTRLDQAPTGSYLLVHINPSGMEVGVCHDGQLLLDYRPGGRTAVVDLPTLLETHLNRLSRHVGRYLRSAPPELKRIYLCGEEEAVRAAIGQFKRHSSLGVIHVRPTDVKATWQIVDSADGQVTAAALGAMLAAYLPGEVDAPNLMQHIIECKREPLRPKLVRSAIPMAATLLAMATLSIVNARQERTLDEMRGELDSLAVAKARATELRGQLLASKAKLIQLEKLASQLPGQLGDDLLRRLAGCMPSDVWLNRLEIADRATIRLQGASYLEAGVYDFVHWLEQAPSFAEVALKGTSPGMSPSGPTTSFDLEVNLGEEVARGQGPGDSEDSKLASLTPDSRPPSHTPVAYALGSLHLLTADHWPLPTICHE
ncbi:MAG TPA: PilN domain-containing protein [Lacipirellula sp.]